MWTEHYTKALNHRPSSELDAQQLQAADDSDTSVDVLTIQEVRAAITKLKFGHAAGRDASSRNVEAEQSTYVLHQLFVKMD